MLSISDRFVSLDSDDIVNIDKTKIGAPSVTKCTSLAVFLVETAMMLSVTVMVDW